MDSSKSMYDHFAEVSPVYRELRTTDEAPIRYIRDTLPDPEGLDAADIGCGAGRYDLLLFRHLRGLRLTCVDASAAMLAQLSDYLTPHGINRFKTVVSSIEDLDLGAGSLDYVFTFNAVHHFDFPTFLARSGHAIRPGGRIFVYTRTPEQNAGSIWGRHFPEFNEREDRLHTQEQMAAWVEGEAQLELLGVKIFRYERCASLDRLLAQARGKLYSTFSLYRPEEFRSACRTFAASVRGAFADTERIDWQDENIMFEIGRTDS